MTTEQSRIESGLRLPEHELPWLVERFDIAADIFQGLGAGEAPHCLQDSSNDHYLELHKDADGYLLILNYPVDTSTGLALMALINRPAPEPFQTLLDQARQRLKEFDSWLSAAGRCLWLIRRNGIDFFRELPVETDPFRIVNGFAPLAELPREGDVNRSRVKTQIRLGNDRLRPLSELKTEMDVSDSDHYKTPHTRREQEHLIEVDFIPPKSARIENTAENPETPQPAASDNKTPGDMSLQDDNVDQFPRSRRKGVVLNPALDAVLLRPDPNSEPELE